MEENKIPSSVYVLSFGVFIVMVGFGFLMPFFPLFARDLGATALDIGLLMSIFMITRAFLARYFGELSDKFRKRKVILVFGSAAYAALFILFGLARNVLDLYVIRALQGVASAAYWPVAEALIMDVTHINYRGRALGIYMTANNMAFFVGPGLAGGIFLVFHDMMHYSELMSFRYSFIIGGVLGVISLIIILIGVKEPSYEEKVLISESTTFRGPLERETIKKEVYDTNKAYLAFYIMALANGFAMGMMAPIAVLYLNEYLGASPAFISAIMSGAGLVGLISNYPAGWLSDVMGRRGVIVIGMLGSRLSSIALTFVIDKIAFGGLMILRSLFFNISSPSFRALQADLTPIEIRGKIFGTVQSFFNIGAIFGPIIGTYLYDVLANVNIEINLSIIHLFSYGPALNYVISGLLGLFSLMVFIEFIKPIETNVSS